MILPRFDVISPDTVEEASELLLKHSGEGARILAGGTDILVDIRRPIVPAGVPECGGCSSHKSGGILTTIACEDWESDKYKGSGRDLLGKVRDYDSTFPAFLISLHKLKNLKGIEIAEGGNLRVGATTTITEIERSDIIRQGWTALSDGSDALGSPLVRNRGTIGGNIANARPAADTLIPSVAIGASVNLQKNKSVRSVLLENFAVAPGKTVIEPGEVLTEIIFPSKRPNSGSAYYKLANRKALEISAVGVSVWLVLEDTNGPVADVRVALGAVGPVPILAESVKGELIGKQPSDDIIQKAAKAARNDARPIDDHRGTAWYRSMMVEILTARLIRLALKRAGGEV